MSTNREPQLPTSLHFSTKAEGWRHHEAREKWMLHTLRCDVGDELGAEFFCPDCASLNDAMQVAMGADRERARIVKWGRSANAVIAILNTALESESVTMDKVVQTVFDLIEEGAHNEQ